MEKSRYILSIIAVVFFMITGCEKKVSTEDDSIVTNFVAFDLEGGELLTIPKGGAFVDPGYVAMEGTEDVTDDVEIIGTVNGTQVGLYEVTYVAVNKDGYESSVTRTVIVYDPAAPATDITGSYSSTIDRRHLVTGAHAVRNAGYETSITKLAPGFFYVSDFFGGYYEFGAGYGPSYAMNGFIQLNADNTLTYVSSLIPGWGDSLDDMTGGTYNPSTNVVFWKAYYVGLYEFNVTSTKQP